MADQTRRNGNMAVIATMFALFFMIAFVTNLAGSMGVIVKEQFKASNTLSQLGSAANFLAYLFMGIPGGLVLRRKGYKFTSLVAVAIGFVGVAVQLLSGYVGSFLVYVLGAFVAGFAMCLLNLVVNPMLNTLGGEGKKGNQLVQIGCSLNSFGGTLAPIILGYLIGEITPKTAVSDAAPALMIAMVLFAVAFAVVALSRIPEPHLETAEERAARQAGQVSVLRDIATTLKFRHFAFGAICIFFDVMVECGIPNMANLYMTQQGQVWDVGAKVAGTVVGAYWFCMMVGRVVAGAIGGRVSSKAMVTCCSLVAIALLVAAMYIPVKMVTVFGWTFPLSMGLASLCGLCTSVMWGSIFNLASAGLGKYVPIVSGIFMAMVFGGVCLPLQGLIADKVGILNSYWLTVALLAYLLLYAQVLSSPSSGRLRVSA